MSNISIGKLGGRSTYSNSVNSTDSLDSFSFSLTAGGNLSLSLTGLSADANLQLFNSSGTVIRSSSNTGTSAETIEMTGLAAGNYSVSVNQVGTASTNYNLSLTSEYAGNYLSTARNLGDLKGSSDYSDFVGTTDTSDFYRFSLTALGSLKLGLNGLSADANIQVIWDTNNNGAIDTGELLKTSTNTGTTDETISITNLAAGTYFVKAYSGTNANTNYNLSLSADYAGKTFSSARNLGDLNGSSSYSDFVGTTDTSDRYRFNLTAKGNLNVGLSGLSADANLQVIRDANNNGAIDTGDVIKGSYNSGTTPESISLTNLAAGTYFVHVYPGTGVSTNYNLSLTSEYAGNTLGTARNLGDLNGSSSYSDFVGTTDTSDRYRFNLTAKGNLNVGLSDLSADANLQVIRDANNNGAIDTGDVIKGSYNSGTTSESFSLTNLAAGNYFVQVYPNTGVNTNYNLSIMADYASNTLSTARDLDTLNGNSSYSDFVSTTDTVDFYRFSFSAVAALKVGLNGLSADADIEVIHDTNNNGLIDAGEVLDTSADLGTTEESISLSNLSAGTYFVKAYLGADASTNYKLSLSADYAGKTLEGARNLDTLNGNSSYSDFVGTTDSDDFYRFSLTAASDISFKLNGLSDNANLQVIRDANNNGAINSGEVLIAGTNPGTTDELLSLTRLSAGTYFIQVYPGTEANTNYSLGLTVVSSTSVVTQLTNNSTDDYGYNFQVVGSNVFWRGYDGSDYEIFRYDGSQVTQLTNNSTNDYGYNFQASGSKVVWYSYDGKDYEIFLYDGTTVTQLTNNSTYDSNPQFVGSKVLWVGNDGNDDEIYSYDGTTVTQLTNNSYDEYFQMVGSTALWSTSDGNDYEIYSYDGTTVTQLTNNSYDEYFQIVGSTAIWNGSDGTNYGIYSYDGTTVTKLTNNTTYGYFQMVGSKAIWSSYDSTDYEIYSYDGTTLTQLTNNSYNESNLQVGGSIAVWNGYDGTDHEIFRYDDSRVTQLTNNSTDDYVIQVDGLNIFWRGYDGTDYEIFRYDGSQITQLTNNSTNDSGYNFQASSSNVFWQGYDGTDYEIFRYDGSQVTQLTNNSTNDYGYNFQASGSKVVWYSYDDTDYEIFLYNGTTVTQLTNNSTDDSNPQFVGLKVLWVSNDGNDDEIYSYDGTTVTQLTNNTTYDYFQMVGSTALWRTSDGNDYEIYSYDGTTVTQLTNNTTHDYFQMVGSKAIWRTSDGNDDEIYSYDGTTVTQLTNNSYDDSNLRLGGSIAVWSGYDGTDYEIFRYDDSRVTQLTNNSTDDFVIEIGGSNIFWRGYDGTDYEIFRYSRVA